MADAVEWLRLLIVNHQSIEYIIILVGTAVGGELALFVLGFLFSQGILPLAPVLIFGFLGGVASNMLWFLLGRAQAMGKLSEHSTTNTTFLIITEAVRRVSRGNHLIAVIIIKFLIGTPVLLTIYVHKTSMRFREFIYYQSIAIILSILVLVPVGFLSQQGFSYLAEIFENVYAAIGFLLLIVFLIVVFQVWLERKFINMKD